MPILICYINWENQEKAKKIYVLKKKKKTSRDRVRIISVALYTFLFCLEDWTQPDFITQGIFWAIPKYNLT